MAREEVKILSIIKITPGGNHAWVKTNVGDLRKPLKAIPQKMLDKFLAERRSL